MNGSRFRAAACLVGCLGASAVWGEVRTYTCGPCERYEITLGKALPGGRGLVLNLGVQDGRFTQAWGSIAGAASCIDVIDPSRLSIEGGRLKGTLRCWVQVPGDETVHVGTYEVDVGAAGGRLTGSYTGWYGVKGRTLVYATDRLVVDPEQVRYFVFGEEIAGKLSGAVRARAWGTGPVVDVELPTRTVRARTWGGGQVEANLYLGSVLSGGPTDRFRRAWVELKLSGGKFVSGTIRPHAGADAGWTGTVKGASLKLTDAGLAGAITAEIESKTLAAGTYSFALCGEAVGNSVCGPVASRLGGRTLELPTNMFRGTLSSSARPASDADAVVELILPGAVEGGTDLHVHLDRRDGRFARGAAVWWVGGLPRTRHMAADASGLRLEGGRLTGELKIKLEAPAIPSSRPLETTYRIDAKAAGGEVAGAFRAQFGDRTNVRGSVAGLVRSQEELRKAHAIRPGCDWPFWSGPIGSFAATPGGHELVADLADARLVWKGEPTPPSRCQTTRYGEGNVHRYVERGGATGGGCSPAVAGGKVFLYYFLPHGKDYDEKFVKTQTDQGIHVVNRMWVARADDVVLCMDAATGQTLWKTVFEGEGLYFGHHGTGSAKGAYTSNFACADGRVYVCPTGTKTCCLDAASGKLLWQSPVNTGPVRAVAGGVLLGAGADLVGLDGATGKELWRLKGAGAPNAQPLRWKVDGAEYVIAGSPGGAIVCVEPKTGKVRWKAEETGTQTGSLMTDGEYLLVNGTVSEKNKPNHLGCYRITPDGAERLWLLTDWPYDPYHHMATMHGGHAWLRTGRSKGEERLLCIELAGGKVVQNIDGQCSGASGYTWWMDGRVFVQRDASHSATPLRLYDASPGNLRILGETWPTLHRTTTSYYPILITHAFADGRVFIRGQRGIFCYDLRKR